VIVALTGATGFVGSAVLDQALAKGHQVRALTRRDLPAREGVTWVHGDLGDAAALARLCAGADAVIHVAGVVNSPDRAGFEAGNVAGTQAMIDAAGGIGVDRFVHVSSLSAREPRLSDYGASKLRGEEAVTASPLGWTVVRPPAIYGPRDTEMFELFRMARFGVIPLPPEGRASMIHVADLARLLVLLAADGGAHKMRLYEVDDGVAGGWRHVAMARAIGSAMGRRVLPMSMPGALVRAAARLDTWLRGGKAKLTADRASYMVHPNWVIDPHRLPPGDFWQAEIETRQGLKDTADWYRREGWL